MFASAGLGIVITMWHHLADAGEYNVNTLVGLSGLSQSALSQHLARLREDGLVATRREAQSVWYRLADPKVAPLLGSLRALFCPADQASPCAAPAAPQQGMLP